MTEHDNFAMSYQDSCDLTPLLLIHGFPLDSTMWELQFQDLNDAARILAPDLRGHGRSDTPPPPYTMPMLADDCAGLLDFLAIDRPAVICGLSMGGYVAFEFYRRHPERVAAIILTATRAAPDNDEGKTNRDKAAALVEKRGVEPLVATMLPKLFSLQTLEEDEELVGYVSNIMLNTSSEGAIGALMAMKDRVDSRPMLADIDVPVLIIHGAQDQIVPLAEAQAMHEAIPNSRLVVLDKSGHLPNLEQPDEFNDAVFDFLEELHGHDHG